MNKKHSKHMTIAIFTIAVVSRLLPHAPNFTPVESIALFGGVFFMNKFKRILLPIIALYLTDLILNNTILRVYFTNQEGFIWVSDYMLWNAISILGIVFIGYYLSKKVNILNIGISAIGASLLFFFISNIGVWFSSPMYTKDLQGLYSCFVLGLPFFRTSVISTVVFSYILIGGFYWATYRKRELA
jgi:hypothetical protein